MDRINYLLDGNVVGDEPLGIDRDVKFTVLAAGYAYGRHSRQPGKLGTDGVVRDVAQTSEIARVRGQTVASYGKDGEGQPLNVINPGRGRQYRSQLRKPGLDQLQR